MVLILRLFWVMDLELLEQDYSEEVLLLILLVR
jgi:hypothetical protein